VRETFLWHGRERCTHPEGRLEADDPRWWKWDGWRPGKVLTLDRCIRYVADGAFPTKPSDEGSYFWRKMPSIHMPRWASRITVAVTDVRVERLHAIDGADAVREGISPTMRNEAPAVERFAELWEKINGKRAPWASNPWVWRVEFKRVTP